VINDPAQLVFYEVDGKKPGAAVRPSSREEIGRSSSSRGRKSGGDSDRCAHEAWNRPATCAIDVALDMVRLDRVLAYDPADLTLSVEAGIR